MIVPSEKAKAKLAELIQEKFSNKNPNQAPFKYGFEWGYSTGVCEYFNENIKLRVEIATLKERIEKLEKELDG